MKIIIKSKKLGKCDEVNNDDIHIFGQFFIPKTTDRYNEIKMCLKQNVDNNEIDYIHLLGERIYSHHELGVNSNKIIQTNINKRLTFQDVFHYIRKNSLSGYFILLNSDIYFLSNTLNNLKLSNFERLNNFLF